MTVKKINHNDSTSELWQSFLHMLQEALGINVRIQGRIEGGQAAVFGAGLVAQLELHILHELRTHVEILWQPGDELSEPLHVAAEGGDVSGEKLLLRREQLRHVQAPGGVGEQPWSRLRMSKNISAYLFEIMINLYVFVPKSMRKMVQQQLLLWPAFWSLQFY